jgi:hypothetical protein
LREKTGKAKTSTKSAAKAKAPRKSRKKNA